MLSSLTSYILKKGGKTAVKTHRVRDDFRFIHLERFLRLAEGDVGEQKRRERIAEARARLMSGKGLRGEVYFDHPNNNTNDNKNTKKKKGGEVD